MAKQWNSLGWGEQLDAMRALVTKARSPAQLARRYGVSQTLLQSKRKLLDNTKKCHYGFDVIAEELVTQIASEVRGYLSSLGRSGSNRGKRPWIRTLYFEYKRGQQIIPDKFWTEPGPDVRDGLALLTELYHIRSYDDHATFREVPSKQRHAKDDLLLTAFLIRNDISPEVLSWKKQLTGLWLMELVRVLEQIAKKLKYYCTDKTRLEIRFTRQPALVAGHSEDLEAHVKTNFEGVFPSDKCLKDFAALCFESPVRQNKLCSFLGTWE